MRGRRWIGNPYWRCTGRHLQKRSISLFLGSRHIALVDNRMSFRFSFGRIFGEIISVFKGSCGISNEKHIFWPKIVFLAKI